MGKKNILATLVIFIVLYIVIVVYGQQYLGEYAYFLLYLIIALGLYINFLLKTNSLKASINKDIDGKYKQLEILTALYSSLEIKTPLPETGGWAASPDLLKKITETILLKESQFIVEASSGVSSIIIGYCLKKIGQGKVFSLEHDILYVEKSKALIRKHHLEQYVEIIHAPLIEHQINNKKWFWYDISCLDSVPPIDMVVVDGPPYYIQDLSRYPVIPLLYDKMSDNSILLLDDGVRNEEKTIIKMWKKEFKHIAIEYFNFEFGAFILNKKVNDNSQKTLLAFTTANQLAYNIKGLKSILKN
ncbi:MAG: class I SAM-dependent methyltransferase, partial [Flavobacteriales bacterium]|nr:class I SAM-dependent methyltransferase [Flavobacteriales bacterium]